MALSTGRMHLRDDFLDSFSLPRTNAASAETREHKTLNAHFWQSGQEMRYIEQWIWQHCRKATTTGDYL
jgi:hypothetical protein